ncbi:MAG: hypothetical protein WC219_04665 [Acholeplasmataceae bacterium]
MDYIISFFLSFFSFFIISHFIYRLFGKKQWSLIFLGVIFISSFFDFFNFVQAGYENIILVYVFMSRVLPVIFAAILFIKISGGIRVKKIKVSRPKLKDPNEDIFTTTYLRKIIYLMSLLSIVIALLSYFFIDDILKYVLIAISSIVIIFGLYKLYELRYFKEDKVLLIIGKQKEVTYEMTLDKTYHKTHIKDLYKNEDYLIDKFATIHIYEDKKLTEKHYLYWIATSQVFEVTDKKFHKVNLLYKNHIMELMKYHDAIIKLEKSKSGYQVMKEKKYRK